MIYRLVALLLLTLLLPACLSQQEGKSELFAGGETYYLDSNLGFTLSYPTEWQRTQNEATRTIRWNAPATEAETMAIQMVVTALPPRTAFESYSKLLDHFLTKHPNFTMNDEEIVELGNGILAREILGNTPARTFLVYFISSQKRSFMMTFSLEPEFFHRYLPLFRTVAGSFRILD